MITANELRIGNFIEIKDSGLSSYYRVDLSLFNFLYNGGESEGNLVPIPLTPEILEKCGFILGSRIEIWFEAHSISRSIILDGSYNGGIQYLHQLQNLYYCLCGEELNINLNVETNG